MYNPSVNACGVATSLYTREAKKQIVGRGLAPAAILFFPGRGGNLPPAKFLRVCLRQINTTWLPLFSKGSWRACATEGIKA